MSDNDEFIDVFVSETRHLLEEVDTNLLEIKMAVEEGREFDDAIVNSVFRAFHGTKGTAEFLDLRQAEQLAYQLETLLNLYLSGRLKPIIPALDLIFKITDFFNEMLDHIDEYKNDTELEDKVNIFITSLKMIHSES